ncbi:MAG: hypothetical protein EHM28_00875 [Spirochaetaceae bacterium]|nr:MAG: hypothetical protein EHM28_00875 [Spirochaetaceae bacterium]
MKTACRLFITANLVFLLPVLLIGETDKRTFVLDVLKTHSPAGYAIMNGLETAPETVRYGVYSRSFKHDDLYFFIDGYDPESMVLCMNACVHENNHSYTGQMAYILNNRIMEETGSEYYAFYLGNETAILKMGDTFPSSELGPGIPQHLRSDRYDLYIKGRTESDTTQKRGIYGLLDEFNSYYAGTQAAYDMLHWYKLQKEQDGKRWADFMKKYMDTDINLKIISHNPAVTAKLWANMELPYTRITVNGKYTDILLPCINEYYKPFADEMKKPAYVEMLAVLSR